MSKQYEAVANFTNGFREGYDLGFKAGFEEASKPLPKGNLAENTFSAICSVCGKDFAKEKNFGWMCYNDNCPKQTKDPVFSYAGNSMIG